MSILVHLIELRNRIIKSLIALGIGMAISFFWLEPIVFRAALLPLGKRELLYLGLGEAFSVHLTFAFYLGIVIAVPIIAYQVWAFVAPGLYPKEKSFAFRASFLSVILFATGAAFGYFFLLPTVVKFFLSFEADGLRYGGALEPYLSLVSGIVLGAGIAFQLPLLLLGLMKAGIVSREAIASRRRYWMFVIIIAGAILTPTGDAATLAVFCLPLWLLFEITLFIAKLGRY